MSESMLALESIEKNDNTKARRHIDTLRLFRATLAKDFLSDLQVKKIDEMGHVETTTKGFIKGEELQRFNRTLTVYSDAENAIERWLHRIDDTHSFEDLMKSDEGIDSLIDTMLPSTWNFNKELVFLFSDYAPKIARRLKVRGQKNILIFAKTTDLFSNSPTITEPWQVAENLVHMAIKPDLVVGLEPKDIITSQRVKDKIDQVHEEIIQRLKTTKIRENTIVGVGAIVPKQKVLNASDIVTGYSLEQCRPLIENRPVVVVNPGPSLQLDIENLKKSRNRVVIIAVAQACVALAAHDISPDLVCIIDPMDHIEVLKDIDTRDVKALILIDGAHPKFYSLWPTIKKVILPAENDAFDIAHYIDKPKFQWLGGSVSITALRIALGLKASAIGLLGQDLHISSGSYYGYLGGAPEIEDPGEEKEHQYFHEGNYYETLSILANDGREVRTIMSYWSFLLDIEAILKLEKKRCKVFNFSKYGAFIEGTELIEFNEFVKTHTSPKIKLSTEIEENSQSSSVAKLKALYSYLKSQRKLIRKFNNISKKYKNSLTKKKPDDFNYEVELLSITNHAPVLSSICARALREFRYETQAYHDTIIKKSQIRQLAQDFLTQSSEYLTKLTKGMDQIENKIKKLSHYSK